MEIRKISNTFYVLYRHNVGKDKRCIFQGPSLAIALQRALIATVYA